MVFPRQVSLIKSLDMGDYKSLIVWQMGKELAVEIYKLTKSGSFAKDFRFRDQIRAAAVSIPSNIAEGDELKSTPQAIHFFHIAKGSLAELTTQLIIAKEINYVAEKDLIEMLDKCDKLSRMLFRLIKSRAKQ
jgi:four helix bundle protein